MQPPIRSTRSIVVGREEDCFDIVEPTHTRHCTGTTNTARSTETNEANKMTDNSPLVVQPFTRYAAGNVERKVGGRADVVDSREFGSVSRLWKLP